MITKKVGDEIVLEEIKKMSNAELEGTINRLESELSASEDESGEKYKMLYGCRMMRDCRYNEFHRDLCEYIKDLSNNERESFEELLSGLVVKYVVVIKPSDYYFHRSELKFYAYLPVSRYNELPQESKDRVACQSYIWQEDPDFERLEKSLVDGKVVFDLELVNEEYLRSLLSDVIFVFAFFYRRDGSFIKAAVEAKEFLKSLIRAEEYWSTKIGEKLYELSLQSAS